MQATLGQASLKNSAPIGGLFFGFSRPSLSTVFHLTIPSANGVSLLRLLRNLCHGAGSSIGPSEKRHPQG